MIFRIILMKNTKLYILLLLPPILIKSPASGQELRGLSNNPVIKSQNEKSKPELKTTSATKVLLSLPFFDDFSYEGIYPDPSLWSDKDAFINNSYPDMPISVGVATLDAIGKNGDPYAQSQQVTRSDHLTSHPIDLGPFAGQTDTVFLSFFYQAGGKGELPERNDTLLLDFYSAKDSIWLRAWDKPGDTLFPFRQVIVPVNDTLLQEGFRFRFANYTSMSVKDVLGGEGALSNVDHWHIDYVQLEQKPRNSHAQLDDIMFVKPLESTLILYETVPWTHTTNAQFNGKKDLITIYLRNAYDSIVKVTRSYLITDLNKGTQESPAVGGNEDFGPNSVFDRSDRFNAGILYYPAEYGQYEIKAMLSTDDEFKQNDTITRIERYEDYYAYDDGTPEFGFGITGESSAGAKLAYRFHLYKEDTLRAIDIYFNKTQNDYTANLPFTLCVWNNKNNEPGELIHCTDSIYFPETSGNFLHFRRYPLGNLIPVKDTVYIGLQQTQNEFLNIGYDANNYNRHNIFVNTEGVWFKPSMSIRNGSLMIRPVFGKKITLNNPEISGLSPNLVSVYPNPANHIVYLEISDPSMETRINTTIYDLAGNMVYNSSLFHQSIDVSGLQPGVYIIRFTGKAQKGITKKLIIIR